MNQPPRLEPRGQVEENQDSGNGFHQHERLPFFRRRRVKPNSPGQATGRPIFRLVLFPQETRGLLAGQAGKVAARWGERLLLGHKLRVGQARVQVSRTSRHQPKRKFS